MDHLSIRRRIPLGTSNKRAAEVIGNKIDALVCAALTKQAPDRELSAWMEVIPAKLRDRLVSIGIIAPARAAGGKPLVEHLEDFRQSLLANGNTVQHSRQRYARIKRIFDECGFVYWSDISASKIQQCVAGLKKINSTNKSKKIKESMSARTRNYHLGAIKSFCHWMVQDRRANESPLSYLKPAKVSKADTIKRRAMEPDELRTLLDVTAAQPGRFNMTGQQRAMLYRLAVETGLRALELRSLTVSSFDFVGNVVSVESDDTKNRKGAVLPLKTDTAELLKRSMTGKLPQTPAFTLPSRSHMAGMFKADLLAAGIDPQDDGAGKLDFHALRHTFGSLLAAAGVHPKVAQDLMRHSDINLTMSRYTHTLIGQKAAGINALPDLSRASNSQTQRKTGTDDTDIIDSQTNTKIQETNFAKSPAKPCVIQRNPTELNGKLRGCGGNENLLSTSTERGVSYQKQGFNKIVSGGPELTANEYMNRERGNVTADIESTSEKQETDFAKSPAKLLQKYPELCQIIEAWPSLSSESRQQIVDMAANRENDRRERD